VIRRLDAYRARRHALRQEGRDEGMAMVFCMVFIILGMLIVMPLLDYATTVLHSNRIQNDKTSRAEAVRGALRIALADPKALYTTCGASGLHLSVGLASPGLSIPVQVGCTTLSAANALS
jgi:type II secretory pathway component PulK